MKLIPLNRAMFALVDDEDFEALSKYRWFADEKGYVRRGAWDGVRSYHVFMHKEIMRAPRGQKIDHKNRNTLDNQKLNLRPATSRGNRGNSKLNANSTSGFKGVTRLRGKWQAQIGRIYLGLFTEKREAAKAYDDQAVLYYGEFAETNKTLGLYA